MELDIIRNSGWRLKTLLELMESSNAYTHAKDFKLFCLFFPVLSLLLKKNEQKSPPQLYDCKPKSFVDDVVHSQTETFPCMATIIHSTHFLGGLYWKFSHETENYMCISGNLIRSCIYTDMTSCKRIPHPLRQMCTAVAQFKLLLMNEIKKEKKWNVEWLKHSNEHGLGWFPLIRSILFMMNWNR